MNTPLMLFIVVLIVGCASSQREEDRLLLIPMDKIGTVLPRNLRDIEASPWGIQASTLDPVLLEKAADIGVKWTRLGASWNSIETGKGIYDCRLLAGI